MIDELHAYDAYMSRIIQSLLQWCKALRIPVILLSATLQDSQRLAYLSCYMNKGEIPQLSPAYPLITQVDTKGKLSQTSANATMVTVYGFQAMRFGEDCSAIVRHALDRIRKGGCYCILVNTVRRAQEIYRVLMEMRDGDTETLLFHARFPIDTREQLERTCLHLFGKGSDSRRPKKSILVATQVVEQSLDIDFDGMLSELAPVDLLLQRAGRVHRHRERRRPAGFEEPIIEIILPGEDADISLDKRYGSIGYVYAPFLLNNTEHMVENGLQVRVPDDVRSVIAAAYENITAENKAAWQEQAFGRQLMEVNAESVAFPEPMEDVFFAQQNRSEFLDLEVDDGLEPAMRATTRLGDPTFRIAFVSSEMLETAKNGTGTDNPVALYQ